MSMKKRKQTQNTAFDGVHFLLDIFLSPRSRRRLHHLFPLLSAVSGGFLFLFAFISFLSPPITHENKVNNYHHPNSFNKNEMVEMKSKVEYGTVFRVPEKGESLGRDLWSSRRSEFYHGCSNPTDNFPTAEFNTHHNRYLMIATSGGLNQQRSGITDAVVAAHILSATLVVPKLDHKSFWKDTSNFSEIFDEDWFISSLSNDVDIIQQLPTKGGKVMSPYTMRVPRKCTPGCYQTRILPVLNKKQVRVRAVQLTKYDYRLSNRLDVDLQKLRCRVNYHALKFTDPILVMGKKLVERMKMKSQHFIALHLRFEPDMLAFSGCYYGGGDKERGELSAIRKRWKNLHARNPDKERRHGKCPLTPEEVGLMLRALGFGNDVHIYVASGEVYRGEEILMPLKAFFPNFHSKETIASKEELAQFSSFSSRMAALDFIVCEESDVFVSNNNGNMARMLAGRRRYFGHKPTIRPNAKKLDRLFMDRANMTWEEFASKVQTSQIGFMGEPNEVSPGRGVFYENPSACICETYGAMGNGELHSQSQVTVGHKNGAEITEDYHQYWSDIEYVDNENGLRGKQLPNRTDFFDSLLLKSEQPELEEKFSDQI